MNHHDRSEIGTDAVAEACSLAVGHTYDGHERVAQCARGDEGVGLLKKSIVHTNELNITSVLWCALSYTCTRSSDDCPCCFSMQEELHDHHQWQAEMYTRRNLV